MAEATAEQQRQRKEAFGRSPRRLLLPIGAFLLVLVSAIAIRRYSGEPGIGELVLSGGVGMIAIWALIDGLRRAFGYRTYLGTGRGLDRFLGLVQAATTVGVAIALLPNAVALLGFLARLTL
jgi:hypothetical protein